MLDKTSDDVLFSSAAGVTKTLHAGIKSNPFVGQYTKLAARPNTSATYQTAGQPQDGRDLFNFFVSAKTVANSGSVEAEVSKIRVRINKSTQVTINSLELIDLSNNQKVAHVAGPITTDATFDLTTADALNGVTAAAQETARKFTITSGTSVEKQFAVRGNLLATGLTGDDKASITFNIPNLGSIDSDSSSNVGIEWIDRHLNGEANPATNNAHSVNVFWVNLDDNANSINQPTGAVFTN